MALFGLPRRGYEKPVRPPRQGWWAPEKIFSDAGARGYAESESTETNSKLPEPPNPRVPAHELSRRAFGAERKRWVGRDPGRETSGGAWRHRARD